MLLNGSPSTRAVHPGLSLDCLRVNPSIPASRRLTRALIGMISPAYAFRPGQVARRLKATQSGFATVRLPWGALLTVHADEHVGNGIVRTGIHELVTTEVLWRLADPELPALDVGANVGYFTSLLQIRSANVLAFEPHPEIREELTRNADGWRNVEIDGRAASDKHGSAVLSLANDFEHNRGNGTVIIDGEGIVIETVCLDEVVTGPVGIMKLDIEGHERAALRGAEGSLGKHAIRDIVFEDHNAAASSVLPYLRSHGYELFGFEETFWGVLLVDPLSPRAWQRWSAPNYLATLDPTRARRLLGPRGWRSLKGS